MKRKVIIVTDGDGVAREAVETAASNVGGCTVSRSSGNPTSLTGSEAVELIKRASKDPVVVMVDDNGDPNRGDGESVMQIIAQSPDIDLLGVVAVASNTEDEEGTEVDSSISRDGKVVENAVDKSGAEKGDQRIVGDTLTILNDLKIPVVIGLGDPGKMEFKDDISKGAPLTTKALQEVLNRSGFKH